MLEASRRWIGSPRSWSRPACFIAPPASENGAQANHHLAKVRRTVIDGPLPRAANWVAGFDLGIKDMDERWPGRSAPNPMPGKSEMEIRPSTGGGIWPSS